MMSTVVGALFLLLLPGCTGDADTGSEAGQAVTSRFVVEGMTCGGCEVAVRSKVGGLDGVVAVEASYREGDATVTYDPERVSPEAIAAAIRELGYAAEIASEDSDDAAAGQPAPQQAPEGA